MLTWGVFGWVVVALAGPDPCAGDYRVATAADLDALKGCKQIRGSLEFVGTSLKDVPLPALERVEGRLSFRNNPALTSLSGLSALTSVGVLDVDGCPALTRLGLSQLTSVGELVVVNADALTSLAGPRLASVRRVQLVDNDVLADLSALAGLTALTDLEVVGNPKVAQLDVFSTLTTVENDLYLSNNRSLVSSKGLSSLTKVGRDLHIVDNGLSDLDGLSALTTVGRDLQISGGLTPVPVGATGVSLTNHARLQQVDGLSHLTSVGRDLSVEGNPALTQLDGLSGLTHVGRELLVQGNPLLADLGGLKQLRSVGVVSIRDNPLVDAKTAAAIGSP